MGTEEQHFKGCSSFDVPNDAEDNEDTVCSQFELGEVTGLSCKSVCNGGDFCNDLSAQGNGEMCYTCEAELKIIYQNLLDISRSFSEQSGVKIDVTEKCYFEFGSVCQNHFGFERKCNGNKLLKNCFTICSSFVLLQKSFTAVT